MNFDTIYERFKLEDELSTIKHQERLKKNEVKEKVETDIIKKLLNRDKFELTFTNGYVFEFSKNGFTVHFVNQSERFCCYFYKTPENNKEREILQSKQSEMTSSFEFTPQIEDVIEYFSFKHKIFDGSIYSASMDLIRFFNKNYGIKK